MKKILSGLLALCLLLCLGGCQFWEDVEAYTSGEEKPKTFQWDGISIELTTRFVRLDFMSEDFDFVVGKEALTVMGKKVTDENNNLMQLDVMEYAELIGPLLEADEVTKVTDMDGIPTLQCHMKNDDGEDQTFALMFYKGEDCFWVLYFGTLSEDFEQMYVDICKYAKTVKVD